MLLLHLRLCNVVCGHYMSIKHRTAIIERRHAASMIVDQDRLWSPSHVLKPRRSPCRALRYGTRPSLLVPSEHRMYVLYVPEQSYAPSLIPSASYQRPEMGDHAPSSYRRHLHGQRVLTGCPTPQATAPPLCPFSLSSHPEAFNSTASRKPVRPCTSRTCWESITKGPR